MPNVYLVNVWVAVVPHTLAGVSRLSLECFKEPVPSAVDPLNHFWLLDERKPGWS